MKEVKVTTKQLAKILHALKIIHERIDDLDDLLPDAFTEYFGDGTSLLQDTILDMCGVPAEKTPFEELSIKTDGMDDRVAEYGFCRDYLDEKIYDLKYEIEGFDYEGFIEELMDGQL
jgi:hypothetical protein